MYELRIFDTDEEQGYVISNYEIINALDKVEENITKGPWQLYRGAYGYGEYICSLEDKFKDKDMITVDGGKLFSIIRSAEEYFYNFRLQKCNSDIQIGFFDSTFYFVKSENIIFLKDLESFFRKTSLISI